ncbi:MAG: divergent PAP2 family protein [Caldilineaceae bacterium]|nr:divergent PAP2 family protein [Caldilineaceae bacterium]MCB9147645.1 divergent PAP2 family protein [Caldilineaceae bacterium]
MLFSNVTLWLPLSVTVGVQVFKFLWELIYQRQLDFQTLFRTGGMPSSHSAMVTSLATAVAHREGVNSSLFAISIVLAAIVMYDAQGVRQQSGKQARVLNRIVRELFSGHSVSEEELKELLGHTSFEVFVGGLVGIAYSLLWLLWILPA